MPTLQKACQLASIVNNRRIVIAAMAFFFEFRRAADHLAIVHVVYEAPPVERPRRERNGGFRCVRG
jgi:hypothetical protein